jgi:Zn-dependent metalloprotease
MLRKRGTGAENNFKEVGKKPEAAKVRLVWALTLLFMLGVIAVGMTSISRNLSNANKNAVDLSGLPQFPEMPSEQLAQTLDEGKTVVQEYAETTNEQWGEDGEKYIADNALLGGEEYSTLKLENVEAQTGKVVLTYGQYYKDVRVQDGSVTLEFDPLSKAVTAAKDTLQKGIDLAVDPTVTAKAAMETAQAASADRTFSKSSLQIAALDGKYYLVWSVIFRSDKDKSEKTVLVGAMRGNILQAENKADNQTRNIAQ